MEESSVIDDKDRKIIEMLIENGRITFTEMAKVIGITEAAVRKRVKRLEEEGIIKKYTAVVNHKALGYNVVSLVGIDVESDKLLKIADTVASNDWARKVWITTGDHMIMIEVWARDNDEFMKIIEELGKIEGVKRVCPAIVLETIKI